MKSRILIIEDDKDILDSLKEVLELEGYDVDAATNGQEALNRLAEGAVPDLIVLDLMMPVMDGFQFREHQRADARLSNIPVVVMSADGQVQNKISVLGTPNYLRKPIDLNNFLETIQKCLIPVQNPL